MGIDHEPAARKLYGKLLPSYTMAQTGLFVNLKYPHLGCSPDGIVTLPKGESTHLSVERIYFDESFWLECVRKLNDFYVKFLLPEFFTQSLIRSLNNY